MAIPADHDRGRSFLARQVGTLALSHVQVDSPMAVVRAAAWSNTLSRLGLHLPLFVIHDIGLLLSTPQGPGGAVIGPRGTSLARVQPPAAVRPALSQYQDLLRNLASSEVVVKAAGWRLRDELVAVLLCRALADVYHRWRDPAKAVATEVLPLDLSVYADLDPATHFHAFDAKPMWTFLEVIAREALHVYTSVELVDLDTIKLLGVFKEDTATGSLALGSSIDVIDLLAALGSTEASDIANFSLDLLPSVLETKRASGAQTFAVDGYASIERKGNLDSLLLSELAYDEEIFEQKAAFHELLYYAHERQRDEDRRLHYILVDSSASMRGRRQVFARGLALTLAKKLSLEGDEVWMRFFDSRLHELLKVSRKGTLPVPHILSFRSEHGRNYSKVFRQLLLELSRLRRDQRRQPVVYIITHGQCHIEPELVAAMAQHGYLYGIIILPSQEVTLDFLPFLHRAQIVESASLSSRSGRKERALDIVGDATAPPGLRDDGFDDDHTGPHPLADLSREP